MIGYFYTSTGMITYGSMSLGSNLHSHFFIVKLWTLDTSTSCRWPKSGGKSCSLMPNVLLNWIYQDRENQVKHRLCFLWLKTLIHLFCSCRVELMDAFGLSPHWIYRSMGTVGEMSSVQLCHDSCCNSNGYEGLYDPLCHPGSDI